ncbi:hypothetical protein FGO68_gene5388 [Halteria grandinella]|uniref:Uncharacterized protein n=1 Tax=Halteria grandinella TaxID=5974 RepID=A0A8J8T4D8_HALGN|nr:hypothetical protein FGO68_gene5388 [Halteria grandinella]
MKCIKSSIINKLLCQALESMMQINYTPKTFKQCIEEERELLKSKQNVIESEMYKIIREKAQCLQSQVNEIIKGLKDALLPNYDLNDEKYMQLTAALSAIYLGLCTNLTQACDKELFQSVKSQASHLFYEVESRTEAIANWIIIPKYSKLPKLVSYLKFTLKNSLRPKILVDPMSLSKICLPQIKFRKFKDLQPSSDLSLDDVYICHYEKPLFNQWILDNFTVFYVPGFGYMQEKGDELRESLDIYDIVQLHLKLKHVQSQLNEMTTIQNQLSQPR